MTGSAETLDHRSVGILGVLTICTYGCWYYAFGVLLDPILEDTGWRESTLAASFSAGQIVIGLSSLAYHITGALSCSRSPSISNISPKKAYRGRFCKLNFFKNYTGSLRLLCIFKVSQKC